MNEQPRSQGTRLMNEVYWLLNWTYQAEVYGGGSTPPTHTYTHKQSTQVLDTLSVKPRL